MRINDILNRVARAASLQRQPFLDAIKRWSNADYTDDEEAHAAGYAADFAKALLVAIQELQVIEDQDYQQWVDREESDR